MSWLIGLLQRARTLDEPTRHYIYRVLSVLGPAAVFYGLLSGEESALWLGVAGTVLQTGGTALAAKHTRKRVN